MRSTERSPQNRGGFRIVPRGGDRYALSMRAHTPQDAAHPPTHVLVMDDTPALLDLFQELLEDEGYRVTVCQELLDLPQIRAVQPDAIIQDLRFAGGQETGG